MQINLKVSYKGGEEKKASSMLKNKMTEFTGEKAKDLQPGSYYSLFTDEETEVQRS